MSDRWISIPVNPPVRLPPGEYNLADVVHPMRALYEAIEAYRDAWEALDQDYEDAQPVVDAFFAAENHLDRTMEALVPTDDCGRWPWEDHYGEPDPNA